MTEETITILKVGTDDAVKSVGDLRNNVKLLKENLEELEIGTEEYQDTLDELKVNQNALKDAMYATSTSLDDLSKSATGTGETYNALVHRMASLKEELRATDVSTEQGKKRFAELADEVNNVNDKLKAMDALQGNFQRNVGNYQSAFKGLGEQVDGFGKGLKALKGGAEGAKGALDAMSKTPALAVTGLLVSAIASLISKFKESEEGANAMEASMVNLKPIMNFLKNILSKVSEVIGSVISKASEFLGKNGLLNQIVEGIVGVGNSLLQFVIAPFKAVISAIKVFKDEGIGGIRNASKAFAQELKEGVSFKSNFEAGQAVADALMKGVESKKEEAKETAQKVGEDIGKKLAEGIQKDFDKALATLNKKLEDELKERLEIQKEIDAMTEEEWQRTNDEIEKYFEEQARMREQDLKDAEEKSKAKVATLNAVVSATSGILGSLADLYETDEKNSEKNAEKVKALRIASATIDTISGALGAFTQASETLPPPYGQIVGALNASLVTTTGIAQIAKIRNTSTTSTSSPSFSSSATTSAPTVDTGVTSFRNITTAQDEERLNKILESQRVYILASDIESSLNASKTRVAESSF